MPEWQGVLWVVIGAIIALVSGGAVVAVQRLLSRRADRLKRMQTVWEEVASRPAGTEATPLQVVREALTTQQEVFRGLTLSAREEALQLSDADLDMQQRREVNRRTQLVLLQLEELAGDFERTLVLKQRAEEELQALAQEAERQRSRSEPQPVAEGRPGVPEGIRPEPPPAIAEEPEVTEHEADTEAEYE